MSRNLALMALLCCVGVAAAQVSLNFDNYTDGLLVGQDGWYKTVPADPMTGTIISTDNASGGPGKCVEFTGINLGRILRPFPAITFGSGVLVTYEYDMKVVNATTLTGMDFRPRVLDFANGDSSNIGIMCGHNQEPAGINNSWYGSTSPTGLPLAFNNEAQCFPKMLSPKPEAVNWNHYKWVVYFGTGLGDAYGRLLYGELNGERHPWFNCYMGAPITKLDRLLFRGAAGDGIIRIDNVSVTSVPFTPSPPTVDAGPDQTYECGDMPAIVPSGSASVERVVVLPLAATQGQQSITHQPLGGPCRGDLNCDGTVGFNDINPFVLRLSNPAVYGIQYPGCPDGNGDINEDGQVTFQDINPFVSLMSSGQGPCAGGSANVELYKWCNATNTFKVYSIDQDGVWSSTSDNVDVTVGNYGDTQLSFDEVTAPQVGHFFGNSVCSSGTHLYYLTQADQFLRTTNGTTWETLPAPPLAFMEDESGKLAFAPGVGAQGSILTYRKSGDLGVVALYNIAAGSWNTYANDKFGNTGFVVVGNYAYSNIHASDTDQGGHLGRIDLLDLNAAQCTRSSIKGSMTGDNSNWFSRVVQMCVVNGQIFGLKNDWVVNRGTGDRFWVFDPADWAANYYIGPNWNNWTNPANLTPAVDLGLTPREPGYGTALVALPAGWKGFIGSQGGVFVIWGRTAANNEGWGGVNDRYGIYDIELDKWTLGVLPGFSSSGTAACFHNGEVWIKQGCSNSSNPDWDPTPTFWVSDVLIPPILKPVADAGPDQGPLPPQPITLDGTGSYATAPGAGIAEYTWTIGATVVGYGPTPQIITPAGQTTTVNLVVTDTNGVSSDPDAMNVTLDACAGSTAGYVNEFNSTAGVTGAVPVELETYAGDTGVSMFIPDASGYYHFDVTPVCPIDASGGKISLKLRNLVNIGPPDVGWWVRVYTTGGGERGYFMLVPKDGAWYTVEKCIEDPDYGNDNFDPTSITHFLVQCVVWDHVPLTMSMARAELTKATTVPVANAGPDQLNVPGSCGQLSNVTLNGNGSTGAATYTWLENGVEIANTAVATVQLAPGTHYITLEVADEGGCARDTDEVVIHVQGAQPLPVELALDEQIDYGLGEAITVDEETSNIFEIAFTDIGGQPLGHVRAYLIGADWYRGPYVDLVKACYGTIDMSAPGTVLRFEGRYWQDDSCWDPYVFGDPNNPLDPFEDAPIFVTLRDANGKRGCLGILYGPNLVSDPNKYPAWKAIESDLTLDPNPDFTDADFDITRVFRVEFFGTDWGGLGCDWVDLKNLYIGPQ